MSSERTERARIEAAMRAAIDPVDGRREGWVCVECDPYQDPAGPPPAEFLVPHDGPDDPNRDPVCSWHKDEAIHDAIPYGLNCSRCGLDHSALWPGGELLDKNGEEVAL